MTGVQTVPSDLDDAGGKLERGHGFAPNAAVVESLRLAPARPVCNPDNRRCQRMEFLPPLRRSRTPGAGPELKRLMHCTATFVTVVAGVPDVGQDQISLFARQAGQAPRAAKGCATTFSTKTWAAMTPPPGVSSRTWSRPTWHQTKAPDGTVMRLISRSC